ncbi:MAG: GNAT family N-acetyltransferase [Bryobacteraceae bacterium]
MKRESSCGEGANLRRFLKLRGWGLFYAAGAAWVRAGGSGRWLMPVPDYATSDPEPGELEALLREHRMLALRYRALHQSGIPSGLYVCREKRYSMRDVCSSYRQAVRRGLQRSEVRPVGKRELLTEGLECNRDTMVRQQRWDPEFGDARRWERFVDAAFQAPGVEVTGAFVEGQLAAYQVGCLDDGWWSILHAFSRTHLRVHHPNHALMFYAIERQIRRPEVSAVCAGPRTLFSDNGLHAFKTRIGFRVEPCEVVVRLHPWLEPLVSSQTARNVLRMVQRARPGATGWQRAAAILGSVRKAAYSSASAGGPGRWGSGRGADPTGLKEGET